MAKPHPVDRTFLITPTGHVSFGLNRSSPCVRACKILTKSSTLSRGGGGGGGGGGYLIFYWYESLLSDGKPMQTLQYK
jgi:hypothetical protein